ncbi:hypothetical protein [Chitinophaga pinensis]|uniref:Uncharacterized protein n=1 Tax=Chitinophaga pinensis TaxID=79329 RepID=A0A5C6LMW8_9BACT|nr:hypothetical protein [Chitinophaga pinensis]TWV95114.1 hypothetical protein FEF09_24910 [Chitinophaga pinensis]
MSGSLDFYITANDSQTALYKGTTKNGTGDFTGFVPDGKASTYVIHVKGADLPEAYLILSGLLPVS